MTCSSALRIGVAVYLHRSCTVAKIGGVTRYLVRARPEEPPAQAGSDAPHGGRGRPRRRPDRRAPLDRRRRRANGGRPHPRRSRRLRSLPERCVRRDQVAPPGRARVAHPPRCRRRADRTRLPRRDDGEPAGVVARHRACTGRVRGEAAHARGRDARRGARRRSLRCPHRRHRAHRQAHVSRHRRLPQRRPLRGQRHRAPARDRPGTGEPARRGDEHRRHRAAGAAAASSRDATREEVRDHRRRRAGAGRERRHFVPSDHRRRLGHLRARAHRRRHRRDEHDGDVGVRAHPRDRHPPRGRLARPPHRSAHRQRGARDLTRRARARPRCRRACRAPVHARRPASPTLVSPGFTASVFGWGLAFALGVGSPRRRSIPPGARSSSARSRRSAGSSRIGGRGERRPHVLAARRVAPPRSPPRGSWLPRVIWVLVASAFVCGGRSAPPASRSAGGTRRSAARRPSRRSSPPRRRRTRSARGSHQRGRISLPRQRAASLVVAPCVAHVVAKLGAHLTSAQRVQAGVVTAGRSVGGDLAASRPSCTRSSVSRSTPSSQLDAGYVQAQVAYVSKTSAGSGCRGALAAQAAPAGH